MIENTGPCSELSGLVLYIFFAQPGSKWAISMIETEDSIKLKTIKGSPCAKYLHKMFKTHWFRMADEILIAWLLINVSEVTFIHLKKDIFRAAPNAFVMNLPLPNAGQGERLAEMKLEDPEMMEALEEDLRNFHCRVEKSSTWWCPGLQGTVTARKTVRWISNPSFHRNSIRLYAGDIPPSCDPLCGRHTTRPQWAGTPPHFSALWRSSQR